MRRIAALLFVLCFATSLFGQATTASVTGFIQDPSKAFVPGVTVVTINTETDAHYVTKTDKTGSYDFPSLQPGHYRMQIQKPGFKTILKEDLELHVQSALEVNFQMAVGSQSESITVTGDSSTTTSGTVSTVIDKTLVENMPLNGRDLTTLFELSPGTILNAGGEAAYGGGFSVDGQRPTANYLTIDGTSGDAGTYSVGPNITGSGIATSASGGTNGILPIDAIKEYRMDTSTYTAENGRTPGGQIQVRTKSGTNQFHGTLYENFRNQVLDDTDWFVKYDGVKQAQLRMNDFGGTLGGPLLIPRLFDGRNKVFFFVANDNLILDQPVTSSRSDVPSAALTAQAYSPFQKFMEGFPKGNTLGGSGCISTDPYCDPNNPGFDFFSASYPFLVRDHTTSVRIDAQIPHSIHAFIRANIAPSTSYRSSYDSAGADVNIYTYTGGVSIPIGPRGVNELTVNRTNSVAQQKSFISPTGGNNPTAITGNMPSGLSPSNDNFAFALYSYNFGAFAEVLNSQNNGDKFSQWNIVDALSLQLGKNALKLGVDVLTKRSSIIIGPATYEPAVILSQNPPYTDLEVGNVDYLYYTYYNNLPSYSLANTSLFANDDWKLTPTLTVNAGVRWEYNPPPSVGPLGVFALQGTSLAPATIQASISNKPLYQTRYDNFAPRFGFSWTPSNRAGSTTVIRGGVGIYFDTGEAAVAAGNNIGAYPYQSSMIDYPIQMPYSSINWPSLTATPGSLPLPFVSLINPSLLSPRTYEWSLTLEQQFGKSSRLSASYIGNDGEKLIGEETTYNSKNATGAYTVNTSIVSPSGYLNILANQSHSNYQALQLQLTSNMGQRLTALASYTWAHAEDNGETDFSSVGATASNAIAPSDNDIRHIFAAAIHYAPASFTGNRILRVATGGWALDTIARLQTASPFSVTDPYNPNPTAFLGNVDIVPGVPIVLHEHTDSHGNVVPGNKLLNWAAFTSPPTSSTGQQLRQGDSPTNGYRLFGLSEWDVALSRTWKVWRELDLNFRIDAFNLINIPNFAEVASGWTSSNASTFGKAQNTYAGFYGAQLSGNGTAGQQLGIFQNGGPREVQLSMKLKF